MTGVQTCALPIFTLDVDGKTIDTTKDALMPGATPGTVSLKPDAAGNQLKPGMTVSTDETTSEEQEDDEEKLDELGKNTLANYVKGATDDIGHYNWMRGIERKDNWNDLDDYEQDRRLRRHDKEYNREKGIDRALKRLVKEDIELDTIKKLSGL